MNKILASISLLALSACVSAPGTTSANDPIEGFNRNMLAFNLAVDDVILEPVSDGYRAITPQWGRDRVSNFFSNLNEPGYFVNNLLQGNLAGAGDSFSRFAVNSTFGVAGLFDLAEDGDLPARKEDFGQTLAVWGVDSGPYLVLPLLGPSNPRDLVGFGVGNATQPLNYVRYSGDDGEDTAYRVGIGALNGINARAQADEQIETLKEQLEPYTALKDIHIRQRNAAITNGAAQESQDVFEELPEFDDDF